ncbi:DUF6383 domain-containing protein, partial [Parabacteroides sp.]
MNKRIFTLMAAAMLLGAPMSNVAFAASPVPTVAEINVGDKGLANGVKFILSTSTGFVKVTDVEDTKFVTKDSENATAAEASVFEIRNFSNKTFELWVNGKQFVTNGANAADADNVKNKSFYAVMGDNAYDKANFTSINTVELGSAGTVVYTATAQTRKVTLDAEALNKNMSGKGFSFQFPGAKSTPDKNPFGNQMVAVNAQDVLSKLDITTSANGFVFAVANEAGLKLLKEVTADNVKAATFVVVDPQTNFGITGFGKGEGQDFTTVKGDKLSDDNVKKDGKIAYVNGIYEVVEEDALGAAGQYTITMASLKVKGSNTENDAVSTTTYVGAYSLTSGGLKSYITTIASKTDGSASRSYAKAQTTGNTWAKASDILNTTGAAIYNIYFTGTLPSADVADKSLYGTYLVSNYATTGTDFSEAALAPNKVSTKAPSAQWAVVAMGENGDVTFQNVETNKTFNASLYKTDKAGIYDVYSKTVSNKNVEQIKLIPVTATEGFLTLSDEQLKQKAQLVFNGEDNLVVSEVYMTYDGDDEKFIPVSDADKSQYWTVVKAESVKNQFDYIYLKDNEVTKKEGADMLSIQAYYLTTTTVKANKTVTEGLAFDQPNDLTLEEAGDDIAGNLARVVFKKNVNGTYAAIVLADKLDPNNKAADNYKAVVKADAQKLYVERASSAFAQIAVAAAKDYSNVTISLNTLGESLDATPRHAVLNSEEGAVSFKANKNGILEGIIAAEGLTLWLDTADSKAEMPTFYISKGSEDSTVVARNFLYYAKDSMYYWNENKAKYDVNAKYALEGAYVGTPDENTDVKAIFRAATLAAIDTLNTTVAGKEVVVAKEAEEDVCLGGVENFKYYITKAGNGYVISPKGADINLYLYNLNGKLGFTKDVEKALVVTLSAGDPTSNESIEAESSIKV